MKRISFLIPIIFCLVISIRGASFAQALPEQGSNNGQSGTVQPSFDLFGSTDAAFGLDGAEMGPVVRPGEAGEVIPGNDNDVAVGIGGAANSASLNNTVNGLQMSPVAIGFGVRKLADPSIGEALVDAALFSQDASANAQAARARGTSSSGGANSVSDDSELLGRVGWASWQLCVEAERAKNPEQFNQLDAYTACGGGALENGYSFEKDPRWAESKKILVGSTYIGDDGKQMTADDKGQFMRLSQFLFAKKLINSEPVAGTPISRIDQAQIDTMHTFSSIIGDLMFGIVVKDNQTFIKRWNMDQFTLGGSSTPVKLQSRHTWVFNRTKELFSALMDAMYNQCIGGVTIGSDGTSLSNAILDRNPFELTGTDAYQAVVEEQKEEIYKKRLKVSGYKVKQDTVNRLFLLWLSRRSKNPLNPECRELIDSSSTGDDSDRRVYADPQQAEFGIYDTNASSDEPIDKVKRNKAVAEYAAWSKANVNFVNPEERRLLLTLSYNLAATDYYGQLISAYNFVKRVPSSGVASGSIRSAGFKLVLKQAGAETLAEINEMMVRHLKAIEEVTRQLNGDFK